MPLVNNYYGRVKREGDMASSVDLGSKLEKFVANLIKSGRYNSKSEVLREGVRLIQERETRLAALDASIARGIADADAGRVTPADEGSRPHRGEVAVEGGCQAVVIVVFSREAESGLEAIAD